MNKKKSVVSFVRDLKILQADYVSIMARSLEDEKKRYLFCYEKWCSIQERFMESEAINEIVKKYLDDHNIEINLDHSKIIFEKCIELELNLLQVNSIDQWNLHLKNFVKKQCFDLTYLQLIKELHLLEEDLVFDNNTFLFKSGIEDLVLVFKIKNFDIKKDAELFDLVLHTCLKSFTTVDHRLVKSDGEIDFWKKVFGKMPYPMAAISDLGDLIIYNELFAKMGLLPKECLRFKDLETTENDNNFFKVRRIDFKVSLQNVSYFVFYTNERSIISISSLDGRKNKEKSSADELGIISSSIAHELNNPLAGILAAIALLSLEDNWSAEALTDLEDMRNGAKRCKELVEIFLGFSRLAPHSASKISIKDSLDQAINLLRFRMIESSLRLDMRYRPTLECFQHSLNHSVVSMIFYLICSELMTAFAHHRLLTDGQQTILSGEFLDLSNQILIKIDDDFEYEEKIAQSKLIQHLLMFERLELNFLNQEMRIVYRTY